MKMKFYERMWTRVIQLRMGITASSYEHSNEPSGSITFWKFLEYPSFKYYLYLIRNVLAVVSNYAVIFTEALILPQTSATSEVTEKSMRTLP
jgi:hypothetical protein